MKLVVIQGLFISQYVYRDCKSVVKLESWHGDYDFAELIENYRVGGADAL